MSYDSETVEDTVKAEVTDDSCTLEFIEIVPLDREDDVHDTTELIQPLFEISAEDLQKVKQETAGENENGYPNYNVKQEPGVGCETKDLCFTVQVSSHDFCNSMLIICVCLTYRLQHSLEWIMRV